MLSDVKCYSQSEKNVPSCAVAIFVVEARKFGHLGSKFFNELSWSMRI
jgi:hypothetical protein